MTKAAPNLFSKCSRYFSYSDLIHCGETQAKTDLPNLPEQQKSYEALRGIALNVLDLVVERFGPLKLTYGFCSRDSGRASG